MIVKKVFQTFIYHEDNYTYYFLMLFFGQPKSQESQKKGCLYSVEWNSGMVEYWNDHAHKQDDHYLLRTVFAERINWTNTGG